MGRTVKIDKNLVAGIPAKPSGLSPRASAEWDRLRGELEGAHIALSTAHRTILSMAATIAADMVEAWSAVERDGAYITGKAGLVAHPASKRLDALRRDYIKVLTMLGLRAAVALPSGSREKSLKDLLADE